MAKEMTKTEGQNQKRTKRTVSLPMVIAIAVIVAACSFILGARGSDWLASFAGNPQNQGLPRQLDYSQLEEIYAELKANFNGTLDAQALLDGAKKGLVQASGDPYTEYFTDKEASEFFGELDGKFSGIGAELGKRNNLLTIISTIEGSPAAKAGLKAGDVIGQVNSEDTKDWSVEKAVSAIRGEKGTSVKLVIARGDEVKTFTVVRDDIVDPSVRSETLDGNIGYIRLSRFNDTDSVKLTRQAAEKFKQQGVKGVILDLRGNGGGYVDAAQQISSIWLPSNKTVVEERGANNSVETLKAKGGQPVLQGVPTVVLVDGGSASASEIVAGALQDNGAAQLVGEKTYGKGSVQRVIDDLNSGGLLKVTIAKWYTPKGKNIDKEGITPGTSVKLTEDDVNADRDPQRDKAVELLKK